MTTLGSLNSEQLVEALKGALALQHFDRHDQMRRDIEKTRSLGGESGSTHLGMRVRTAQTFSMLNSVAAEFGPVSEYTPEIHAFADGLGFPEWLRGEVRRRLENGFAVEAYKPKSLFAGTPSEAHIDARIRAQGREPTTITRTQCYAELARGRASIEARAAQIFEKAIGDLAEAEKLLLPSLPLTRDDGDADSPPRPFAADEIDCSAFLARIEGAIGETGSSPQTAPSSDETAGTVPLDSQQSEHTQQDRSAPQPSGPTNEPVSKDVAADQNPDHHAAPRESSAPATGSKEYDTLEKICEGMLRRNKVHDVKRQRQYRGTAKLLQTVAGTDKSSEINEAHLEEFRDLLDLLPSTYGRSPADFKKSFEQLKTEGKALPPNKRGLKPGTINRRMGEARALIKFAKKKGYRWVTADFEIEHVRDPDAAKNKRGRFTDDHLKTLFTHGVWTDPTRPVWPSVYFVPILSLYGLARREEIVGLQLRDIFVSAREIHIRANSNRRLKNGESDRTIPIPEEAIRLGFLEYVASLPGDPYGDVFPEIKEAAPNTKMGDTFYKRWDPILREAIPDAKEAKVVFHSFRHTGIDIFVNMPGVPKEIRRGLSGHAQEGVDVTVYLKKIESKSMRRIMKKFPLFTAHLQPRDWKKPRRLA